MRSPEHRNHTNRTGQNYENDASSRHKTPGAFTILPPEDDILQDPPMAPQPYRLTPSSRRHKNMSFAIVADPNSAPGSRSPSPTGRVSPFRGRGFNPIGSRHASPVPSPPPEETFAGFHDHNSKIPRLSRRGSATVFGEEVTDYRSSPNRRKLNAQLSQSLTNIAPRRVSSRPPPSPRRPPGYSKTALQRLSPIVGSSPEPSQSQSSPKLNTSSQQKFISSPGRSKSFVNRQPRNPSKPNSKAASREPSPSKTPTSPTRIPVKNYKNVQAKVNSFSRTTKPKVPPKPQVLSEETTEESDNVVKRRRSVKSRTNSRSNLNSNINKTNSGSNNNNNNNNNNKNVAKDNNINNKSNNNNNKNNVNKRDEATNEKTLVNKSKETNSNNGNKNTKTTTKEPSEPKEEIKKSESVVKLSDLLQPSTTAVVSSTTTTVTQPLKIEAKIDTEPSTKPDNKSIAPMVDGRILSATSVSNAMNKMNDTVLTSQTLMKESGLTKASPAATTVVTMSAATKHANPALDTKNATTALPSVGNETKRANPALDTKNATTALPTVGNMNSNHVTSTGIVPSARVLEQHVQNNMSKLISPDHKMGNSIGKSANDRIIEARTVVAHDVKPIKITVKEKPMDAEVQSGNIRFDTSNGLAERPGLPPPNPPNNDSQESQESAKGNVCTRFLTTCKKKMSCKRCKKEKKEFKEELKEKNQDTEKTGCFNCRKKKPEVTISIENEEPKKKFWERMKCCGKNKVGDNTGCLPTGKRKGSWVAERRDSILSDVPVDKSRCSKLCCGGFFRKIFCLDKCRKKRPKIDEVEDSRRASMMSKKKSLTPSIPVEQDTTPKLDSSLVEHTSQMKAAIPVLPVCLAWFCLVMNCIGPGTGTIFSGMFCLCIGKPRFSQKDGARARIGAFIIDLVIGIGQFFTVLFCLVGWGWSIWWGVIMVKLAKKHRKIRALEANAQEGARQVPAANHSSRDPERGS